MKDAKSIFALLLVLSTFLGSVGQLLFKVGLLRPDISSLTLYVFLGIIAYGTSTVFYFYTLSRAHLSWTYGFNGLGYIFASFLAFIVLGESLSALRILGVLVIAVGTAIIGLS